MTTPPKETTPPAPSTEDTGKSGMSAGTLRSWIREEIANLIPGGTSGEKPKSTVDSGQPADLKGEVAAALQQLKAKEDRQKRDERVDKMLTEFEKPKQETAPKEIRKVHKLMGWGE